MDKETKTCNKCGEVKPLTEYYKDKSSKDGLQYRCKSCQKEQQKLNREKISENQKVWRSKNKDKLKIYTKNSKEYQKKYKQLNKEIRNKQHRYRYEHDTEYNLICNLRRRFRNAVNNNQKFGHTLELLGCTIEELKLHLEKQFKKGMNWNNNTKYGWHIDHIIPCASFDLTKEEQQKACFHYTNLQPLWAEDNLKKGCKTNG